MNFGYFVAQGVQSSRPIPAPCLLALIIALDHVPASMATVMNVPEIYERKTILVKGHSDLQGAGIFVSLERVFDARFDVLGPIYF